MVDRLSDQSVPDVKSAGFVLSVYVTPLIFTERLSDPPLIPPQVPVIVGVVLLVTKADTVGASGLPRLAAVVKSKVDVPDIPVKALPLRSKSASELI